MNLIPNAEARDSCAGGRETSQDGGDRQLLERFIARRDEAAFAELVRRHSGMVWGVCRRVLGRAQDAEDAFQGAFLVLARKAAAIRKGEAVGSWLYAVAFRIAMVARKNYARRSQSEKQARPPSSAAPPGEESTYRELQRLLDEELQRLPEKYRAPFILCCLQGLTRAEVARELGWREGTVAGRVARARALLQKRLIRRGVTVAGVLAAGALAPASATAAPPALVAATTEGTLAVLAGKAAALSPSAVALAETVLKGMTAIKLLAGLVLLLTLSMGTVAALQYLPGAANPDPVPAAPIVLRDANTFRLPSFPLVTPTDERILTMALAPDGKRLVTAGAFPPLPGQLTVWDLPTGKPLARVRGIPAVRSVAFAPDGRTLVSGDFAGMVRLRDASTGVELGAVKAHALAVNAVAFAPDGQAIVSVGLDGLVKLRDAKTLRVREVYHGHTDWVLTVAFFRHGRTFVTGSRDGTAKVWDIGSAIATKTLPCGPNAVEAVAVARDNRTVATLCWGGTIKLWDALTGQEQAKLLVPGGGAMSLAISPDGKMLACGGTDGSIHRWDVATRKPLPSLPAAFPLDAPADGAPNVATRKPLPSLPGHAATVWALAFASDSKTLWSGSADATVRQWNLETGKALATLTAGKSSNGPVAALAYAPDGKTFALAAGNSIHICDAERGTVLNRLDGPKGKARCLAFAPGGKILASGAADKAVVLWDLAASKPQQTLVGDAGGVRALAFAPDGRRLASAGHDGKIKIWDLTTGHAVTTFTGQHHGAAALAFGPDDMLASAGEDGTVRLWSLAREGAEPRILRGHRAPVQALAFSVGGRTLVSGDADGVHMVWDPARGLVRQVLPMNQVGVTALTFHPQNEHLLSGNVSGAVMRWQGEPPPPPPPTELLPERFYQDFRGARLPLAPARVEGKDAEAVTRPEEAGLRITLPTDWNKPGVWVRPHVLVAGDFDITARYELLGAEPPRDGGGVGVVLLAVSPGSKKMAKLCRLLRPLEGDRYLADITDNNPKPRKITTKMVPTYVRAGQLRLVREGSTVRYLVADTPDQEFREIHRDEFGDRDVREVAFSVSSHGSAAAVDARLVELRIRSGKFTTTPSAATPIAAPGVTLRPRPPRAGPAITPAATGARSAATVPSQDPDAAPTSPRRFWLMTAVILFILFAVVGLLTVFIRRARVRPGGRAAPRAEATSPPGAAEPPVRVTCASCGQVLRVRPTQAGKTGKCPRCGAAVYLPENAPVTTTATPGAARTVTPAARRIAVIAVLGLLLGGGGLYFALASASRPDFLNVPLGSQAVAGVEEAGFYDEEFDSFRQPFRWTDGKARLVIPLDRAKRPRALWLQLHTSRPPKVSPVTLRVVVNGQDLFNEVTDGVWEKTFDLSATDLGDELTLDILSSIFIPQDVPALNSSDCRPLGVRVTGIRLLGPAE